MKNDIDKLDGMIKIKGKCGYDIIGGCKELRELKIMKNEVDDFISDISTCGFRYDDRSPCNLNELQICIEYVCNKFNEYKNGLKEINKLIEKNICFEDTDHTTKAMDKMQKIIKDILNEDFE